MPKGCGAPAAALTSPKQSASSTGIARPTSTVSRPQRADVRRQELMRQPGDVEDVADDRGEELGADRLEERRVIGHRHPVSGFGQSRGALAGR